LKLNDSISLPKILTATVPTEPSVFSSSVCVSCYSATLISGDNEHDISNALRLRRLYCIRFDDEKKMRHMWLFLHVYYTCTCLWLRGVCAALEINYNIALPRSHKARWSETCSLISQVSKVLAC